MGQIPPYQWKLCKLNSFNTGLLFKDRSLVLQYIDIAKDAFPENEHVFILSLWDNSMWKLFEQIHVLKREKKLWSIKLVK